MTAETDKTIKVLVVDDSAFMRRVISDILNADPEITVVDTARNGLEALEKAKTLKPDLITLDIEMPVMDGLSCLNELMKNGFTSVIIMSSLTNEGADCTIQALECGAVDFITKPENIFEITAEAKKNEIIEKAKIAGRLKKGQSRTERKIAKVEKTVQLDNVPNSIKYIVAIGTSTGGPKALQSVIPLFPADIPAAFLVVQHMPPGFTKSLAERLDAVSELKVKEAEDGEVIRAGHVYIAPGDYHMLVTKSTSGSIKIKLSREKPVSGHRPSVNVMMDSLAQTEFPNVIGVIMTGMGGDGSEGIKKIKKKNKGYIIAQDEKSCVVYGMPKTAVQTGAVDIVLPLDEISNEIMRIVGVHVNGDEPVS